jgi:DNA-binding transcriptional LysR family regulator
MDLNWFEDLIELAAVRNFSTAASARNISQPAFSRRIRALENWVGVELVDRGSYPASLTRAGETLLEGARELTRDIYRLRDECRRQQETGIETLKFSTFHTIALSLFPSLLTEIEKTAGKFVTRMEATDFYDCIESLTLGRCDFAVCYSHPLGPPVLETHRFVSKRIGVDPFRLVTARGEDGTPLHGLDPGAAPLPLIAYSAGCFLTKIQNVVVQGLRATGVATEVVYENSISEVLKRMILVGKGVGLLPLSCAEQELADGRLAIIKTRQPEIDLNIDMFRRAGGGSAAAERFWASCRDLRTAIG